MTGANDLQVVGETTLSTVRQRAIQTDDAETQGAANVALKPTSEHAAADKLSEEELSDKKGDPEAQPPVQYVWTNILFIVYLHIGALCGLVLLITRAKWLTVVWFQLLVIGSAWGITAGAHRLFSHKSYKAKAPTRLFLVILNCIAAQNDIIEWSRDHRVHHKFSETSADPHDARRGIFFSHMGWLMVRKHPEVKRRGKTIDMSDLEADPILRFQRRFVLGFVLFALVSFMKAWFYRPLMFFFNYVFPTLVAWGLWRESPLVAFATCSLLRYCYVLHATWSVNSFAHMYGFRPYDRFIGPRQNILSNMASLGEGWHNYHHTFPYDYRASEWGWTINLTTFLLDSLARIGQVYDRKVVSPEAIQARRLRTGVPQEEESAFQKYGLTD